MKRLIITWSGLFISIGMATATLIFFIILPDGPRWKTLILFEVISIICWIWSRQLFIEIKKHLEKKNESNMVEKPPV